MKAVKVVATMLLTALAILWVRGGDGFDIRRVLPLVNEKPGLYQFGGAALAVIFFVGLMRLNRPSDKRDSGRDPHERESPPAENETFD